MAARDPTCPSLSLPQMMEHPPYPKSVGRTDNSTGRMMLGQDRRMGSSEPRKEYTQRSKASVCHQRVEKGWI